MTDYEAEVDPDQPWGEEGTADVTPKLPYPNTAPFSLPLEHRESSPVTVLKSEYPSGLVIIPYDTPLDGETAVLPMKVGSGDSIVTSDQAIRVGIGIWTSNFRNGMTGWMYPWDASALLLINSTTSPP